MTVQSMTDAQASVDAVRAVLKPGAQLMAYGEQYPRTCAIFKDPMAAIEQYILPGHLPAAPFIHEHDTVVTMGSCFAVNIGRHLQQHGINVVVNRISEDANSPLANRLLLEYLIDPTVEPQRTLFASHLTPEAARETIEPITRASCVIFTVGVGISCFEQPGDHLVLTPYGGSKDCYEWRFAKPHEAADDLRAIVAMFRQLNPDVAIVLTLSPVPLYRGILAKSPFVDDCISKSVLRVALHEFFNDAPANVHYWPSFEIVRWLGSHLGPVYGTEDDLPRHVSDELVRIITTLFVRHCTSVSATGDTNAPDPLVREILPSLG